MASRAGLSVTGAPLASRHNRASRWTGGVTSEKPRKSGAISKPFGRSKGQATTDTYDMGDLQPMRLKDEMMEDQSSEKSSAKGVNWRVTAVKVEDVEARPAGTITMHSEIHQHTTLR